jgi:hypothetical protein
LTRRKANNGDTALTADKLAELLSAGGDPVTAADIAADVAEGAPAGADGNIWLLAFIRFVFEKAVANGA